MALILTRTAIQQCITMREAIDAMRLAFGSLQAGSAHSPQRLSVQLEEQGVALLMPSLLQTPKEHAFSLKLVTVIPQNPTRGYPRILATLMLLDATTGKTLAVLEGGWLTTLRTGAASGLATELLAKPDANVLALFGAGTQAPMQALAIHTVRPLQEVRVFNRNAQHFQQLVTQLQSLLGTACPPILHVSSPTEALRGASLVACATVATSPLFSWQDIAPGTHINAIGAFTPEMCEVDPATLAHSRIVVDQREAALSEAGDLLQALAASAIGGPETWSELGEVVNGLRPGRQSAEEVTCFKSVGHAVQDAAIALRVYTRAREAGLGIEVEI
ncbi:MAG TPA: hypothetical protein VFA41_23045 [Ktedonobacteraceae bacterium]|jgi:ornithine cyclodeaminase|nr:hypothetical protein [Ktedonobacteraceae bacterium]